MGKTYNCYLCKDNNCTLVADREQIRFGCFGFEKRIVKCRQCGLVQLVPIWTEAELSRLYAQYSQKKDFKSARQKQTISPYLEKYVRKSDRILEIGCSFGDNLKRLRKKGYAAIGIDRDPTVCDGKTILNHDFSDYAAKGEKFDFIYAIHVFEHIADPRQFIAQLHSSLKEGGRFLLEVPSVDDPLLGIYNVSDFKKFYWYPYHLFFYDRDTLRKMVGEFNDLEVEIIRLQRYGLINHLRWLIFRRPGNFNSNIPLLDPLYKYVLTHLFRVSDTLLITGKRRRVKQ